MSDERNAETQAGAIFEAVQGFVETKLAPLATRQQLAEARIVELGARSGVVRASPQPPDSVGKCCEPQPWRFTVHRDDDKLISEIIATPIPVQ